MKKQKLTESKEQQGIQKPTTRDEAMAMVRAAWLSKYQGTVDFPHDLLFPPTPQDSNEVSDDQCTDNDSSDLDEQEKPSRFNKSDRRLKNGCIVRDVPSTYKIVANNKYNLLRRSHWIVEALENLMEKHELKHTKRSQTILGGLAASHPTTPDETISLTIALARYTFLLELQSEAIDLRQKKYPSEPQWNISNLVDIQRVMNVSPVASTISNKEKSSKKIRIRGREAILHLVNTAHAKNKQLAAVAKTIDGEEFNRRRQKIKDNLLKSDGQLEEKRKKERLDEFLQHAKSPLKENVRTKVRGVDLTSRALGKIPLADLRKGPHMETLIQELRARHIPFYCPCPTPEKKDEKKEKRSHPFPIKAETTGRSKTLDEGTEKERVEWLELTFSDLKDLIMVDEERWYTAENPKGLKEFDHGFSV